MYAYEKDGQGGHDNRDHQTFGMCEDSTEFENSPWNQTADKSVEFSKMRHIR